MEEVIDKVIAEMQDLQETEEFKDIMYVNTDVKLEDPGLVIISEYPYIYVAPVNDTPVGETVGVAGYDIRKLELTIGVVLNSSDFFDPTVPEASGVRELIRASALIRKRLRRLKKRRLDGLSGVRNVVILSTSYVPDIRGQVFVRVAITNITVERQYQHED